MLPLREQQQHLPAGPYAPNNHFLDSTYYGQLYLNPHVVKPGQDITGTAVTRLNSKINWSTPPGPLVAGCQGQDPNCTWKAEGVAGGVAAMADRFYRFLWHWRQR